MNDRLTYKFRNLNEIADYFDSRARDLIKKIDKLPKRSQAYQQAKAEQATYWHMADFLRHTTLVEEAESP